MGPGGVTLCVPSPTALKEDVEPAYFTPGLPARMTMSGWDLVGLDFKRVTDQPAPWLSAVVRTLAREVLAQTPDGALDDRLRAATALVGLLRESFWSTTPAPFVSSSAPTAYSAEFIARGGLEVHLEVDAVDGATVYVLDPGSLEWEGPLHDVPDGIEKWAWRLTHG